MFAIAEWLIPYGENDLIKIECSYMYYGSNSTDKYIYYWTLNWGYSYITKEDIEAAAAAELEQQQNYIQQILDDL